MSHIRQVLFFILASYPGWAAWSFDFPSIHSWSGAPIIEYQKTSIGKKMEDKFSQAYSVILKKNYEFKSPFAVVTASRDFLKLNIAGSNTLEILPKSKMQMPYVHTLAEDEDIKSVVHHILLLDGHYRYISDSKNKEKVKIETAFFNLPIPGGVELVLDLNMNVPSMTISLLKGSLEVSFYDYEKKVTLHAGQKVTFTGVKNDEGVVQYDYLLNRRKSPKGKMSSVQKTNEKEVYKYLQEFLTAEEVHKKAEAVKKAKKNKVDEKVFICKKPVGKQDQCYWKMISGICYRFRCNASGEWSDRTERSFSDSIARDECTQNKGISRSCDY